MSLPYLIPAREARAEIEIKKSRFIASAGPAFSVEQAREFVDRIRAEFPDASHHVPVYLIGREPSLIEHCSDAGEPSGTAGRPALAVIKGSGLRDIVLVVSRYFGGIKLGTGGLVRAYSQAARAVLAVLPRAHKVATHLTVLTIGYSLYERVRLLIRMHQGMIENEQYTIEVTFSARFPVERFEAFQAELLSLTNGAVRAEILATQPDSIIPLE
jgi:uncharacterized YigZ family protein